MSNLFKKNNLGNLFSELNSETSVSLPKYLNVKNINSSDKVSNFLPQKGGSFGLKNSDNTDDQVNQLISMLTSESDDKLSANTTATEILENRLRNMLQNGGAKKNKAKKQRGGGDNLDADLKEACNKLKSAGINVKLNEKSCSDYFGEHSDVSALSDLFLNPKQASIKPTSNSAPKLGSLSRNSATSSNMPPINNASALLDSQTSDLPNVFLPSASARVPSARVPSARVDSATSSNMPVTNNVSALLNSQTSDLPNVFLPSASTRVPSVRVPSVRVPSARVDSATSSNLNELVSQRVDSITSSDFINPSLTQRVPSVTQRVPSVRVPSVRVPSARVDSVTSSELPNNSVVNALVASETSVDLSPSLRVPSVRPSPFISSVRPSPFVPSTRVPSTRALVNSVTSSELPNSDVISALAQSETSTNVPSNMVLGSLKPGSLSKSGNVFSQYSAPKYNTPPNLLDATVSTVVGTVNGVTNGVLNVGEGALGLVDDVLDGVINTVTGTVKAVVGTVLDDSSEQPKKVGSIAPQVTQAGGAKRRSKKSSKKSKKSSKKSSKKRSKKSSKKRSKKSSKKASKKLSGGANAGFEAFLKLKKAVAELLGISNGPAAGKAAGAAQREIKAKHPDMDSIKVSEEALKLVKANPSKYKDLA